MPASPADWTSALVEKIPPPWREALGSTVSDDVVRIGGRLSARIPHERVLPHPDLVFRALQVPPHSVSVLIIGQDPYPTAEHAMGLAFSVPHSITRLPPTAVNIRKELQADLGLNLPAHFDLSSWVAQGVLLLNRHLTTAAGSPGAHHQLGWTSVTDAIVRTASSLNPHMVSIVWGKQAAQVVPLLPPGRTIESAHPSPLSAHRGFFGSKPFSRTNTLLRDSGHAVIDWALD